MILRDYLNILRKYLWAIIVAGIIGLAVGTGASVLLGWVPLYSATATVLVGGDVATVEDNSSYTRLGDQFLETYADLATRTITVQRVIDRLGLDTTASDLQKYISAEIVEATQLLNIIVTDADPERAAAIANAIADELIQLPSLRVRNFVVLVEEAEIPTDMEKIWLLIILVAGTLGVILMSGIAFVIEFFRDPVYSADELTQRTDLPVLTTVRYMPDGRRRLRRGAPNWHEVNKAVWWPLVQLCRQRLLSPNGESDQSARPARILVTSPTNGRTQAIVAANLAATWASDNQKVLLIDANLHEPFLNLWFNTKAEPGLADLMRGSLNNELIAQAPQKTDIPNLMILPAGNSDVSSNSTLPVNGLAPTRLEEVLAKLSADVDIVILVGSPLLTTGDGIVVASQAGGILLTLRVGNTTIDSVNDTRNVLAMMDSELLGTILSEVG